MDYNADIENNRIIFDPEGFSSLTPHDVNIIISTGVRMSIQRAEKASLIKDNMPKLMFTSELVSPEGLEREQDILYWFDNIEELLVFETYEKWVEIHSGLTDFEQVQALSILDVLDDHDDMGAILDKTIEIIKNVRD